MCKILQRIDRIMESGYATIKIFLHMPPNYLCMRQTSLFFSRILYRLDEI
ncbi:hypothetical protein [Sphingobacterium bambusae]